MKTLKIKLALLITLLLAFIGKQPDMILNTHHPVPTTQKILEPNTTVALVGMVICSGATFLLRSTRILI